MRITQLSPVIARPVLAIQTVLNDAPGMREMARSVFFVEHS